MEGIRKEIRVHLTNLDAQRAARDRLSESILRDQINDLTYRLGEGLSPPPGGRPTGPLATILRTARSGAQTNLDQLLDRRAADWLRQHGIEAQNEDRPTKEFHQRLERSEPERNIPVEEIKDNHTGNTTSDQGEINTLATEHFRQRFNQPYDDSTPQVRAARDRLLRNAKRLPAAARSKLESDQIITAEHIQQTINSLPLHKTPGEDGFPSDWYRAFAKELSPLLRDMYLECEQQKQMTPLMRSAVTSLVYKNKGSRQDLSKYRPLTVTPTEYKILAKAMQLALTPCC